MGKLFAIIDVLYHGKSLTNAAAWKRGQQLTNALMAVVGGLILFLPQDLHLSHEDVIDIVKGVIAIGASVNGYLTVATTKKMGIRARS
jgi:hypothetical protein